MRYIWIVLFIASVLPSYARDNGQYVDNPLKTWFNSLKDQQGVSCCDTADGKRLEDVDWDVQDGHYRVRLDGLWIDVPDMAVVKSPNKFGPTVVWPYMDKGKTVIRCFLPGAGS